MLQTKNKTLTNEETLALIKEYQKTKDMDIRNEVVVGNLGLVVKTARDLANKYSGSFNESKEDLTDELTNVGTLGMMKAIDAFDFNRKDVTSFSTLALRYIQNAILDFIRKNSRIISIPSEIQTKITKIRRLSNDFALEQGRRPTDKELVKLYNDAEKETARKKLAEKNGKEPTEKEVEAACKGRYLNQKDLLKTLSYDSQIVSYDSSSDEDSDDSTQTIENKIADTDAIDPGEQYDSDKFLEKLPQALNEALDDRERDIFLSRNSENDTLTLKQLGEKYHIREERVRQIENEAKKKLRDYLLKKE